MSPIIPSGTSVTTIDLRLPEEIDLRGGSACAGGVVVITTTTSAKNANAIIADTIKPGGGANAGLCFVRQ